MILKTGDKLLIVHRRLFETDAPRFFIGAVEEFEQGLVKVTGHTWIQDTFTRLVIKKEGARTKILPLTTGSLIAYQLPESLDLSLARFEFTDDGRLWLVEGSGWRLDMSEMEYIRGKRRVA